MSGQEPDVTSLETRKRILVMESELNRAHLCHEVALLADELRNVSGQLQSAASVASSFFTSFAPESNGAAEEPAPAKPSWLSTIVRGVRFGTSLWLAFRSKS